MEPIDPFAMCDVVAQILAMDGVGVSIVGHPAYASNSLVRDLEEQQYIHGEGPMIAAYRTQRPVDSQSAARRESSWLVLDLERHGVAAAFSFPLIADRACIGAMTLYRKSESDLCAEERTVAQIVADGTAADIARLLVGSSDDDTPHPALQPLCELHQAIGAAAVQLGASPDIAAARLRAHAFGSARTLTDVVEGMRKAALQLPVDTGHSSGLT